MRTREEAVTLGRLACTIGLDVGGTKVAGGIVPLGSMQVMERRSFLTNCARDAGCILADTLSMARDLVAAAGRRGLSLLGLGLAVPELVDLEGNVTSAYNFDWQGRPVKDLFAEIAPTVVDCDIRLGALGEARFGAGRGLGSMVYVSVGTGIGSCLVIDGEPYKGAQGNAVTLASSPLSTTCDRCGAALAPVLDRFASGPALVARYRAAGGEAQSGQEVLAAVQAGDRLAVEVVGSAGRALGVSVAFLVNVLDPEAVVLGGGLGSAGGLYWDESVASTRQHIWSENNRHLPILRAALGPDASLVGAAAAAHTWFDCT